MLPNECWRGFHDCICIWSGINLAVHGSDLRANILGGSGVLITNTDPFRQQDSITCQFGAHSVEAQRLGRSLALCISPALRSPAFFPFTVSLNGEVERELIFRACKMKYVATVLLEKLLAQHEGKTNSYLT